MILEYHIIAFKKMRVHMRVMDQKIKVLKKNNKNLKT